MSSDEFVRWDSMSDVWDKEMARYKKETADIAAMWHKPIAWETMDQYAMMVKIRDARIRRNETKMRRWHDICFRRID